jgi:hypothetical protein
MPIFRINVMLYLVIDQVCLQVTDSLRDRDSRRECKKNSEIRSISLVSIKIRSCLYPMLPFEFGIAALQEIKMRSFLTRDKNAIIPYKR